MKRTKTLESTIHKQYIYVYMGIKLEHSTVHKWCDKTPITWQPQLLQLWFGYWCSIDPETYQRASSWRISDIGGSATQYHLILPRINLCPYQNTIDIDI